MGTMTTRARQAAWAVLLLALAPWGSARAADTENCLSCHRFRGLSRLDPATGELRLFFCSEEYQAERQGPHAELRCTACHEREEVSVVPHHVKTRVDCARACHISRNSGVETRFSHEHIQETLQASVHAPTVLSGLPFETPLLREGQSACLYCHDEPMFRPLGIKTRPPRGGEHARCDICHTDELPVEVPYFMRHVTSRLQPARPVRQLAQVCAVCHSDPTLIPSTGGHDAVASYLHSFHGKASLLGSTDTATCTDCHASETGNVHAMLRHDNPASSTSSGKLPDTCRTTACHRARRRG